VYLNGFEVRIQWQNLIKNMNRLPATIAKVPGARIVIKPGASLWKHRRKYARTVMATGVSTVVLPAGTGRKGSTTEGA
jgi:hypothetical protein